MTRYLLSSIVGVCVCCNVFFMLALAESLSSYADDYKQLHQEFELEKANSDYMVPKQHELVAIEDPSRTLSTESLYNKDSDSKNPQSAWYLVASKAPLGGKNQEQSRVFPSIEQLRLWPLTGRQLSKKQTHLKKNNPRDILRGLAVKRDRAY